MNNFKIKEAFNNKEGQTAIALVCASFLVSSGCVCFSYSVFFNHSEMLAYCVSLATVGATIFTARTIMKK